MTEPRDWGVEAQARLARIARCSAPGPGVTRLPFSDSHRAAIAEITAWMEAAGLSVRLDGAGTLVGRADGPEGARILYMGSHQDSVREGGAYDGIMGVALPCLALEKLRAEGRTLPCAVEVLAFADEEGVRFPTALLGSRAIAGTADMAALELADRDGVTLRAALTGFGCDPDTIPAIARDPATAIGFIETHIEQGPVLEDAGLALGLVTAICGIERHAVTFTGRTGHAGTLPMAGRQDALVGAAAFVTEVNELARATPGLRATVGALDILPNVVNAVPREARLTLELRAPDDVLREAAGRSLTETAEGIAARNGLTLSMHRSYQQPAQPCAPALMNRLEAAMRGAGHEPLRLPSGATHDASAMADLGPIAMLFVRCRDGVSHVPEEYAAPGDLAAAIEVLANAIETLA